MYESQRNPAIPALKVFLFFIRISFFYNPWDEPPVLWDEILTSSFRFQYVKELILSSWKQKSRLIGLGPRAERKDWNAVRYTSLKVYVLWYDYYQDI